MPPRMHFICGDAGGQGVGPADLPEFSWDVRVVQVGIVPTAIAALWPMDRDPVAVLRITLARIAKMPQRMVMCWPPS
jgi:hypothetical protein